MRRVMKSEEGKDRELRQGVRINETWRSEEGEEIR